MRGGGRKVTRLERKNPARHEGDAGFRGCFLAVSEEQKLKRAGEQIRSKPAEVGGDHADAFAEAEVVHHVAGDGDRQALAGRDADAGEDLRAFLEANKSSLKLKT